MRRFANLYIVLFLIDAGLSMADELLKAYAASPPVFSELRQFVASIVVALSVVVYACLGIDRRLPKRLLLPLTLYASWCALALWPLPGVVGHETLGLAAAAGQLLLGGFVLVVLQRLNGRPLLPEKMFREPLFSWRNTLGFTAINLLLLPFVMVFSVMAVAGTYLDRQTAGFLRLSPVGIYMSERTYHLEDKVVRLAGMMHIGKEDYYRDLAGALTAKDAIILAEGVTDRDRLLVNPFSYSKLAGVLGLTSQESMRLNGNLVDLDDLDAMAPRPGGRDRPDVARADLDINRFDPQTIEFLNMLGKTLFSDKPLTEAFAAYNVWVKENMTPERIAGVMADILDRRNAVVIDALQRSLDHYDTVIIPWGAMHMPAIETAVLEQGFAAGAQKERLSLDFRAIPYGKLWRTWSERPGGML